MSEVVIAAAKWLETAEGAVLYLKPAVSLPSPLIPSLPLVRSPARAYSPLYVTPPPSSFATLVSSSLLLRLLPHVANAYILGV
ncbi:hypothetical protein EDB89DRAFT_2076409 [Lactarius sanguifluus]|nr:hypothetical protein EDB89DRAFT_2076409 [Lactarius sanguifluus]